MGTLWGLYFLFATTIGFFWINSWHNEQRAVQIILLIITAVIYAGIQSKKDSTQIANLHPFILVFFIVGLVSASLCHYKLAAFAEVSWLFLLACLVMLSATFFSHKPAEKMQWISRLALLIAITHVAGISVRVFASLELFGSVDASAFVLGFANPRFESALHVMIIPLLVFITANQNAHVESRLAALILASILVCINCALGTRAFWVAYLIAIPVVVVGVTWERAKRFVLTIGVTLFAGILMYLLLIAVNKKITPNASTLPSPTDRISFNRTELWSKAWSDFGTSPLFGIGPYQFATWPNRFGSHPHNWVLQLLSEWGILGTAAFFGATVQLFFRLAKVVRRDEDRGSKDPAFAVLVVCISSLANGLVDGNLLMPVSQSFTAIMIGSAVSLSGLSSPDLKRTRMTSLRHRVFFGATVLVCSLIVLSFAKKSFRTQQAAIEEFRRDFPDQKPLPRFWEQGFLVFPRE
jgi:putative inorganic carbon (HCO3(-)) transporter